MFARINRNKTTSKSRYTQLKSYPLEKIPKKQQEENFEKQREKKQRVLLEK